MNGSQVKVIDASVAVKLILPEALSENARRLFAGLDPGGSPALAAPDLFWAECAQVFWKWTRGGGMTGETAVQALAAVLSLPVATVPAAQIVRPALAIALQTGITAYDACYAALALELGSPLITADERLVRRLAKSEVRAVWLGDF